MKIPDHIVNPFVVEFICNDCGLNNWIFPDKILQSKKTNGDMICHTSEPYFEGHKGSPAKGKCRGCSQEFNLEYPVADYMKYVDN